jgi:hypothetical protein
MQGNTLLVLPCFDPPGTFDGEGAAAEELGAGGSADVVWFSMEESSEAAAAKRKAPRAA